MVVSLPSATPGILLQDLHAMEITSVVMPFIAQLQSLHKTSYLGSTIQLQYNYKAVEIISLLENVLVQFIDADSGAGNIQLYVSHGDAKVQADTSFMYGCVWSLLDKLIAWKKDGLMEIHTGKNGDFFLAEIYLPGIMRQQPETCPVGYFEEVFPVWQTLMQATQTQVSVRMQPGKDMHLQLKCPLA